MQSRLVFSIAMFGLLAGCSATTEQAVTATVSQAQADVQQAINLYGVAKGIGQVAEGAFTVAGQPAVSAGIAAAIAALDPLVSQAQTALNDAATDAAALEALADQIKAQANALTLAAAPAITAAPTPAAGIVPSGPLPTPSPA